MCRNIRKLRNAQEPPKRLDFENAALQYVRKISGYRIPSQKNETAFERAVQEIAEASKKLVESLK